MRDTVVTATVGNRSEARFAALNSNRNPQTSVYRSSAITAKITFQRVSVYGIRSQTVFLKNFFTNMSQNYWVDDCYLQKTNRVSSFFRDWQPKRAKNISPYVPSMFSSYVFLNSRKLNDNTSRELLKVLRCLKVWIRVLNCVKNYLLYSFKVEV